MTAQHVLFLPLRVQPPWRSLSPNVLDQWIDPGFGLNKVIVNATGEIFRWTESILFGITKFPFPSPAILPSPFFVIRNLKSLAPLK